MKHLKPVYKGNRFQVAKRRVHVDSLAREFVRVYGELMSLCAAYVGDYYDSVKGMKASIVARASFAESADRCAVLSQFVPEVQ